MLDCSVRRDVAFIAEVNCWEKGMSEDRSFLLREFNDRDFLDQIREHAKMIMIWPCWCNAWDCFGGLRNIEDISSDPYNFKDGSIQPVLECDISPFSNRVPTGKNVSREHAELIEWGPIEKVGEIASDIQQAAFWTKVSHDVE